MTDIVMSRLCMLALEACGEDAERLHQERAELLRLRLQAAHDPVRRPIFEFFSALVDWKLMELRAPERVSNN